jgi:uncharacterized membrane-anchored protein
MAHFARIENGKVAQVIVINNEVIGNPTALEGEAKGIAFCQSLFGAETQWAQTSYSGAFRGKYAGVGDTFDGTNFVSPNG